MTGSMRIIVLDDKLEDFENTDAEPFKSLIHNLYIYDNYQNEGDRKLDIFKLGLHSTYESRMD